MGVLAAALSVIAPPFCWSCGGHVPRATGPLCRCCSAELRWLGRDPVPLAGIEVWAPVAYDGPARALVRGLKFRGAVGLARPMAAQIAAAAPDGLLAGPPAAGSLGPPAAATALVPVPLHPARARARGYNQAERLASALGARTGLPVADCLRRRGSARARQVGRGRAERLARVGGAVGLRPGAAVPERALVVDDVVTTGATVAACAAVLRAGGALEAAGVAYALTPGR